VAASSRSASLLVSADNAGASERARADRNADSAAAAPGSAPRRGACAALIALLLFAAAGAFADDQDDAQKLKAFRDLNPDNKSAPDRRVEFHAGYVELHYFGMDWRIFYLPLLAPLPGARLEDAGKIPNPFELAGAPYPTTLPPMFQQDRSRDVQREYNRIEKLTKEQKVVVVPSGGNGTQ
jgi:hypothetical protein